MFVFTWGMISIAIPGYCSNTNDLSCTPYVSCSTMENGCMNPLLFSQDSSCQADSFWNRINLYGWVQAGATMNEHGNKTEYASNTLNSPASRNINAMSGNSFLLGTEQQTNLKLSQLWLGVTRKIEAQHGMDWGIQLDMTYGTDARYCQAFGDETFDYGWGSGEYYLGFTQMYAELGNQKVKARVGKFVTEMSHEPLAAPLTYFYSHSYACYSSPLTVSGAMLEYALTDKLTFFGGWTAGYHTSFENRFGDDGFLCRLTYTPTKNTSLRYSLYTGSNNGWNKRANAGNYARFYDRTDVLANSIVFNWTLNDRWRYMIEGHWSNYDAKTGNASTKTNAQGISQHLIYTINSKWSVGTRIEWLNAHGTFFDLLPYTGGDGTDVYEISLGANWDPTPWFNFRPELRYDWTYYDNGFKPFANGTQTKQFSGGCSVLIKF